MAYAFEEIFNVPALERLCEAFAHINDTTLAVVDLTGRVQVAVRWPSACTHFHRKHPHSASRCMESDTTLSGCLAEGAPYNVYRCRNGLVDVAVPITVQGQHIANLFTGQFFFHPPDLDDFRRQAQQFGYNEQAYLDAIRKIPVHTKEKVKRVLDFLVQLAEVMGAMGLENVRADYHQRMEHLAHHDELTGLLNRFAFRERLEQILKTAKRAGHRVGLAFIDLDDFKLINDSQGHEAGDLVLTQVAERLQERFRDSDAVARLGGDEFVLALPDVGDAATFSRLAHGLVETLSVPCEVNGNAYRVTPSVGLALFPDHADNSRDLVRHADSAMYLAKNAGGAMAQLYEQEVTPFRRAGDKLADEALSGLPLPSAQVRGVRKEGGGEE